ncbi:aldo/keto reductase family domain-containing protein [Ditylenchus destructor]|nr:aldo/keto reductase family domain-containing protein [Ditylenchus destructor]
MDYWKTHNPCNEKVKYLFNKAFNNLDSIWDTLDLAANEYDPEYDPEYDFYLKNQRRRAKAERYSPLFDSLDLEVDLRNNHEVYLYLEIGLNLSTPSIGMDEFCESTGKILFTKGASTGYGSNCVVLFIRHLVCARGNVKKRGKSDNLLSPSAPLEFCKNFADCSIGNRQVFQSEKVTGGVVCLADGNKIPRIGLFCYDYYYNRHFEHSDIAVKEALDLGYRLFDYNYFPTHGAQWATALKKYLLIYNMHRSDVFITVKFGIPSPAMQILPTTRERNKDDELEPLLRSAIEKNILDFGGYIDLALLRYPKAFNFEDEDPRNAMERLAAYSILQEFRAKAESNFNGCAKKHVPKPNACVSSAGLESQNPQIRSLGVSNFEQRHLNEFMNHPQIRHKPVVNQCLMCPKWPRTDLVDFCQSNGIYLQAHSSLYCLHVSTKDTDKLTSTTLQEDPLLIQMAKKYKITISMLLLAFDLEQGVGILPCSRNRLRLAQFMRVITKNIRLEAEDLQKLKELPLVGGETLADGKTYPDCLEMCKPLNEHRNILPCVASSPFEIFNTLARCSSSAEMPFGQ